MAGATIDHLIALVVFLGALLLFISLFNQTIQTAVLYQRNRSTATKCSDLLDNMLLNPGYPLQYENDTPLEWGKFNFTPRIFGLQDPEFTQYRLSPFSLMRLRSSIGEPFFYAGTNQYYSNVTMGFGSFLLVSFADALDYSTVAGLLGINNTYGFQLTLTPIISVSVEESHGGNPLILNVTVTGNGVPLANATVSYMLITVKDGAEYPSYEHSISEILLSTGDNGLCPVSFTDVGSSESYAFIAYARFGGLVGVGYHQRIMAESHVIPLVENVSDGQIILAHSHDIFGFGDSPVSFNATFVTLSQDFSLRPVEYATNPPPPVSPGGYFCLWIPREDPQSSRPIFEPGILVLMYQQSDNKTGVALMPWGLSSLGFPLVFGDDPSGKTWIATDLRQVIVGNVAYQAKLSLWSLEGYGVIG